MRITGICAQILYIIHSFLGIPCSFIEYYEDIYHQKHIHLENAVSYIELCETNKTLKNSSN